MRGIKRREDPVEIAGRAMRTRQKEGRITSTTAVTTLRLTVGVRLMLTLVMMALSGGMIAAVSRAAATERAGVIDAGTVFAGAAVAATMQATAWRTVAAVASTDPNSALLPVAPLPGARTGTRRGTHVCRILGCSL